MTVTSLNNGSVLCKSAHSRITNPRKEDLLNENWKYTQHTCIAKVTTNRGHLVVDDMEIYYYNLRWASIVGNFLFHFREQFFQFFQFVPLQYCSSQLFKQSQHSSLSLTSFRKIIRENKSNRSIFCTALSKSMLGRWTPDQEVTSSTPVLLQFPNLQSVRQAL